jgi:hypothetical protein
MAAEADYLLRTKIGRHAQRAFLADLATKRLEVTCMDGTEHARAADIDRCYADLDVGLADLSLIVAAERHGTRSCSPSTTATSARRPRLAGAHEAAGSSFGPGPARRRVTTTA